MPGTSLEARNSVVSEFETHGDPAVAGELVRMLGDDPVQMRGLRGLADEEYARSGFPGKIALLRNEAVRSATLRRVEGAAWLQSLIGDAAA